MVKNNQILGIAMIESQNNQSINVMTDTESQIW
jgi:hypothetical protein